MHIWLIYIVIYFTVWRGSKLLNNRCGKFAFINEALGGKAIFLHKICVRNLNEHVIRIQFRHLLFMILFPDYFKANLGIRRFFFLRLRLEKPCLCRRIILHPFSQTFNREIRAAEIGEGRFVVTFVLFGVLIIKFNSQFERVHLCNVTSTYCRAASTSVII